MFILPCSRFKDMKPKCNKNLFPNQPNLL